MAEKENGTTVLYGSIWYYGFVTSTHGVYWTQKLSTNCSCCQIQRWLNQAPRHCHLPRRSTGAPAGCKVNWTWGVSDFSDFRLGFSTDVDQCQLVITGAFRQEAGILLRHEAPSKASTTSLLLQVVYCRCLWAILWPGLIFNQPETCIFPPSAGVSRPYLPPAPNKVTETVIFLFGKMFAPGISSGSGSRKQHQASRRQAAGKPQASSKQAASKQQASSRQAAPGKPQASSSRQAAAGKQQQASSSRQAAATSVWPLKKKSSFFQAHGPKTMRSFNDEKLWWCQNWFCSTRTASRYDFNKLIRLNPRTCHAAEGTSTRHTPQGQSSSPEGISHSNP